MDNKELRIQKFMSECGVCSRRKAEEMILAGKVKINGSLAKIGDKINPYKDKVTVQGKLIKRQKEKRYIMLHKPRGFVTTMSDEMGRKDITMLTEDVGERVYPVGRLDKNSEGLLLLTNDGEFANMMAHPKTHIPKTYRVTVRPPVTDEMLNSLINGVKLDDGYVTAPAEVSVAQSEENRIVLLITIFEGKNRQIRRMCEALGIELIRLKRISIGDVRLGMLPQGKWRDLKEQEVRSLYSQAKRQATPKLNDKRKRK
ncbi:MAG: pseudouridine synthase [Acutalibacteraceae bacterium]